MNLVEDKIVRLVTGKPSLNEVTIAELQAIADNQPFFAVAQLLLTQKMKQENHPDTASQLQRTSLYFPNIFWLDYQLQDKAFYVDTTVRRAAPAPVFYKEEPTQVLPVEIPSPAVTEKVSEPETSLVEKTEEKPAVEEKIAPAEEKIQGHGIMANVEEDVAPVFATPAAKQEPVVTFIEDDEPLAPQIAAPETFIEEEPELPAITPKEEAVTVEEEPTLQEQPAPIEESFTEAAVEDASFETSIKEHFKAVIEEKPDIDEDSLSVDEIGGPQSGVSNMKIAEMLQQQLEEFKKPVDENTVLPLGSDPYHTVDYFASQGIDVDNVPADAMVKKVKRFTDWLKQMKRISTDLSDLGTAKEDEEQVLGIAASSIKSKEVVTEAMARVLVKQGLIDKAIQVYSKLSFLNPDKSAYFATKILELKGN